MSDDPFAAPESDFDNIVRNRARNNLYMGAASAVFLGFFQFCCNPCFLMTFAAAGASMNAIRQPRWLAISLEEDYPSDAGMVSTVAGYIGLVLCGLMIVLQVLSIVMNVALISAGEF